MNPNYKKQRYELIESLVTLLDGVLINFENIYNNETIEYTCNKCSVKHKFNFPFFYNKIKHKQFCNCHQSVLIDSLEIYSLENFEKMIKDINEEKLKNDQDKKDFLIQETKQLMHIINKNRQGKSYTYKESKFHITCHNNHNFSLKFEDIIKGKWCEYCIEDKDYYFKKEVEEKV